VELVCPLISREQRMMIFRALALMLFLGGLALADVSAGPALAQETNAGRPTGGQTQTAPPTFDPIAARIKYLHDRFRITPDQEPLWDIVAQEIRNNAQDIVPLLKERFRAKTSGSALDVLHSYEALGEAQLDGLKKFIAAFDSLYASLSESQKKIADAILREGPLRTMIGGIPEVPAPFGSPLVSPLVWGGLGAPLFIHRPGGFHHFHGR
jgi:LTXXQ motif family protein